MDRVNHITSVQNLSSVDPPDPSQPPVNHFNSIQFDPHTLTAFDMIRRLQEQQQHQHHINTIQLQLQNQQRQHSHHNRHQRNNLITTNGHGQNHHSSKKELIDLVTCKLCKGYIIDAATLDLCMHSFCRPCAVKFIRQELRCPECNMEIKDKRFLNRLKTDVTIQNIVYKLVPGLYEKEMARRRKFYAARPSTTPRYKSEMFGDIPPSKTIKSDDMLNVSIRWDRDFMNEKSFTTYLYCRADSNMLVLRKLIIGKFGLERPIKIYYGNFEIFFDLTTLMDVAATFNWDKTENKLLELSFKEDEEKNGHINSLPLMNSGLDL